MSIVAMCCQLSLTKVYVDAQCEKLTTVVGRPNNNTQRRSTCAAQCAQRRAGPSAMAVTGSVPAAEVHRRRLGCEEHFYRRTVSWLAVLSQ